MTNEKTHILDNVINTLSALAKDNRLTQHEQKNVSYAWGYMYYLNSVEKKMHKVNKLYEGM